MASGAEEVRLVITTLNYINERKVDFHFFNIWYVR